MTELVVALDVPTPFQAQVMASLIPARWFKIGKRLVPQRGFATLLDWLKDQGKRVMLDEKAWDIGSQLFEYVEACRARGVDALTIRCEREFLVPAVQAARGMRILGVGRLTSQGYQGALGDAGLCKEVGAGMVVNPGALDPAVRPGLFMAATGVRAAGEDTGEHVSAVTPFNAAMLGAELVIVGRPIVQAASPARAFRRIEDEVLRGSESAAPYDWRNR